MVCTQCGRPMGRHASSCSHCRAPRQIAEDPHPIPVPPTHPIAVSAPGPCKRSKRRLWLAAVGVVVVGAATVGIVAAAAGGDHVNRRSSSEITRSTPGGSGSGRPSPTAHERASLTDAALVSQIFADVRREMVSINSYDYRRLTLYRKVAAAATTKPLTAQVLKSIDGVVAVYGPKNRSTQVAKINKVGIASLDGAVHEATVLVFGQLTVTNKSAPHGRTDPFFATVGARLTNHHWLMDRLVTSGPAQCDPPGDQPLVDACAAATTGASAILTFRRASFAGDFARALAFTTGEARADLQKNRIKTLTAMRRGKFDLRATVVATAVETATQTSVVALVAADGYRSTSAVPAAQNFEITLVDKGGKWLLAKVVAVVLS
jgi:hypothetical protein